MISVDEAQNIVLGSAKVLALEKVDLLSSLGRVIGENIAAPLNIPPWDHAAMDGYAIRFEDVRTASPETPVQLNVIGNLPAGYMPKSSVGLLQAFRIMTGAPIPKGADTVVRKEDTSSSGSTVQIIVAPKPGVNIRKAGENVKEGDLVIQEGTILRPPHIGMLASFSKCYVSVYQTPRVAILSTGDEVTEIDVPKAPYKIVNSNMYTLSALVKECGVHPIMLGIARDEKRKIIDNLEQGLGADVIITTGGVSMGDYDFVRSALEEMGAEITFWKVAMVPGKFTLFGVMPGKFVFGLPGNSSSCIVAFEQFVRPALLKLMGHTHLFRPRVEAILSENVKKGKDLRYFVRVRLAYKHGELYATTTGKQGSGLIKSMVQANGLLIVPEDREEVKAGEKMTVQILDRTFELEN